MPRPRTVPGTMPGAVQDEAEPTGVRPVPHIADRARESRADCLGAVDTPWPAAEGYGWCTFPRSRRSSGKGRVTRRARKSTPLDPPVPPCSPTILDTSARCATFQCQYPFPQVHQRFREAVQHAGLHATSADVVHGLPVVLNRRRERLVETALVVAAQQRGQPPELRGLRAARRVQRGPELGEVTQWQFLQHQKLLLEHSGINWPDQQQEFEPELQIVRVTGRQERLGSGVG